MAALPPPSPAPFAPSVPSAARFSAWVGVTAHRTVREMARHRHFSSPASRSSALHAALASPKPLRRQPTWPRGPSPPSPVPLAAPPPVGACWHAQLPGLGGFCPPLRLALGRSDPSPGPSRPVPSWF
eukprot:scaffold4366_cov144-Isochrysis_galbana.AAC.2